jgi:hypothetical protein
MEALGRENGRCRAMEELISDRIVKFADPQKSMQVVEAFGLAIRWPFSLFPDCRPEVFKNLGFDGDYAKGLRRCDRSP